MVFVNNCHGNLKLCFKKLGAQWLSGRVLDSRPSGRGFEPHRRHCVVFLSKMINPSSVLVQPRNPLPYITERRTERLLMGLIESNKQTNKQINKQTNKQMFQKSPAEP